MSGIIFITIKPEGDYEWKGKSQVGKKAPVKIQLVAFSLVLNDKFKESYSQSEKARAFSKYFHISINESYFRRATEARKYTTLFRFLNI